MNIHVCYLATGTTILTSRQKTITTRRKVNNATRPLGHFLGTVTVKNTFNDATCINKVGLYDVTKTYHQHIAS